MARVLGIVLAGGKSQRMGTDKAVLDCSGLRMIDRVLENIAPACSEGIYVGGRDYGHRFFSDRQGLAGPMASIAALESLETKADVFFIIPVDMPNIGSSAAQELVKNFERQSESYDALHFEESHMPLLLRNSQKMADKLHLWLKSRQDDSVHSFLDLLDVATVTSSKSGAEDVLINVNNPGEYKRYRLMAGSKI